MSFDAHSMFSVGCASLADSPQSDSLHAPLRSSSIMIKERTISRFRGTFQRGYRGTLRKLELLRPASTSYELAVPGRHRHAGKGKATTTQVHGSVPINQSAKKNGRAFLIHML